MLSILMEVIAFDLGETLLTYAGIPLSWVDHYEPALRQAFSNVALSFDPKNLERAKEVLLRFNTRVFPRENEVSSASIFSEICQRCSLSLDNIERIEKTFFQYFQQNCVSYPETKEVLEELRTRGFRIFVLTDVPYGMPKKFVHDDIASAGLSDLVDDVVTSVDLGFRKPSQRAFKRFADRINVSPHQLTYVGNEKKDVEGINAIGGMSVLINRDQMSKNFGQSRTIQSLRELL